MKSYISTYKNWLLISLLLHIFAAVFTVGHHNADEWNQILEFAAVKLGLYGDLTCTLFELGSQSRQTIQPFIVVMVSKIFTFFAPFNPFTVVFILRLVSAFLGFLSLNLTVCYAQKFFSNKNVFIYIVLTSNFLWFVPYMHARFQGENWSGIFLAFGIYTLLRAFDTNKNWIHFLIAGLFLGFAFLVRFQVAFALAILGLWLIIFQKITISKSSIVVLGFLIMVVIGVCVDFWYYQNWIFVPYRYVKIQLFEGYSNSFGVFPWWHYPYIFLKQVAPPLSIVLFIMLVISTYKFPKHLFVWIIWGFILGHNINGYKEIRYLYPIFPYFVVAIFLFLNKINGQIITQYIKPKILKIGFAILLVQNTLLIVAATFKPANVVVPFFEQIYSYSEKPIILYTVSKNPYHFDSSTLCAFYKPKNITVSVYDSTLNIDKIDKNFEILFFNDGFVKQNEYKNIPLQLIHNTVPDWLRYFNINNWISRTKVYSLYKPITKNT